MTTVPPDDLFSATQSEREYTPTSDNVSSLTSLSTKTTETTITPLIGAVPLTDRQVTVVDQTTEHSTPMQSTESIHLDHTSSLLDRLSTSNPASAVNTRTSPADFRSTLSSGNSVSSFLNSSEQTVTLRAYETLTASDYPVSSGKMSYDVQTVTDRAVTATTSGEWTKTMNESIEYSSRDDRTTLSTPPNTDRTPETVTISNETVLKQTTSSVTKLHDSMSSYFSRPIVPNETSNSSSLSNINTTVAGTTGASRAETTAHYSVAESADPNNSTVSTVLPSSDGYFSLKVTTRDNFLQSTQSSLSSENMSEAPETVYSSSYTQQGELSIEDSFTTSRPATATEDSLNSYSRSSTMFPSISAAAITTPMSAIYSSFSAVLSRRPTIDTTDSTESDVHSTPQTPMASTVSIDISDSSNNTSTLAASNRPMTETDASTLQSVQFHYTTVVSTGLRQSDAGRTSDDSLLLTGHLFTLSAGATEVTNSSRDSIQRNSTTQTSITSARSIQSTTKTERMATTTEESPSPTAISLTSVSTAVESNFSTHHATDGTTRYSTDGVLTSGSDEVIHSATTVTATAKSDSNASYLSTQMTSSTTDGVTELKETTRGPVEMKLSSTDSRNLFATADKPDRTLHNNSWLNADLTESSSTISSVAYSQGTSLVLMTSILACFVAHTPAVCKSCEQLLPGN